MKLQLLLTGNELMSGHTVDSNSSMIAELIADQGFHVYRKVTIGDDTERLIAEMDRISQESDVLIVNGGLGPTVDDLTAEALSRLVSQPLQENAEARAQLEQWCERRRLPVNDSNLKQAILPKGVNIIPNPTGSAPGFSIEHNQCLIICTPGVPSELRGMMQQTIVELLAQRFPENEPLYTQRFQTFGIGESNLQQMVNTQLQNWPSEVELGFRAGLPLLEIKLTVKNPAHLDLRQQCYEQLQQLMGDYIVGADSTNLSAAVINLLQEQQKKICTAESCTGGLIAASITETAGASLVFEAGFVTYSNQMKQSMIDVPEQTLIDHGAVSEQVVVAMAEGALARSGADYAISVSGIAGPDGGSEDKPVGTVWMAWGKAGTLQTRRMQFNAGRQWFQQMVTATTLDLIRRELSGIEDAPRYFRDKK